MHLYFYIRAIKQDLDMLIKELESQYFKFPIIQNGQQVVGLVQMGVRPWGGFYELVFPKEYLQEMISTLTCQGTQPFAAYPDYGLGNLGIKALSKTLKCKPMPEYDGKTFGRLTCKWAKPDIRIIPIGIKEDEMGQLPSTTGNEMSGERL